MMNPPRTLREERWRTAKKTGVLTALVGVLALIDPLQEAVRRWSFDFPFRVLPRFSAAADGAEAVIVTVDDDTFTELRQDPNQPLDRKYHAELISRLFENGAKAVVLDFLFERPSNPASDAALREALARRRTALVVAKSSDDYYERPPDRNASALEVATLLQPAETLGATNWGIASYNPSKHDAIIRTHYSHRDFPNALALGERLAASLAIERAEKTKEHWINFYGPGTFREYKYYQIFEDGSDWRRSVSNKVVFVGWGDVATRYRGAEEKRTPIGSMYGVKLNAHASMNCVRGDWLEEWPLAAELAFVILFGVVAGSGLAMLRAPWAAVAACGLFLAALVAEIFLRYQWHLWWPWLAPAGAQLGFGLIMATHADLQRLRRLVACNTADPAGSGPPPPEATPSGTPEVPDYAMLKKIGSGAFGDVWLARSIVGQYRAVKVVYKARFETPRPYEREFEGVSNFSPKSGAHPGLLQILHVGRRDAAGFFFYVMEVGDDTHAGQSIKPEIYQPRTLHRDLQTHGFLPVETCIEIGLELCATLQILHQNLGLVHRDIKPSNIVYVNGRPKLADIGLVKDMACGADSRRYVGTEDYTPPEGAGAATADIFSLGKVLYEASMGLPPGRYPDLPSNMMADRQNREEYMQLMTLIIRACHQNPLKRYPSAAEFEAALLNLKQRLASAAPTAVEGPGSNRPSSFGPGAPQSPLPNIPEYAIVGFIGSGGYGDVWLARSAIDLFVAVKIIKRQKFADAGPYERELNAVTRYQPKALAYPGVLQVLHVGRRDAEGWFFYVMEAADDVKTGRNIHPETYRARTLQEVLKERGRLPPRDCIKVGIELTGRLRVVHEELEIVHRDIKPSNIIFVKGQPKISDIGSVKEKAPKPDMLSYVGTAGYLSPEGPGTVQADIFSMGKLLYVALTGLSPEKYPDLPSSVLDGSNPAAFRELNKIIQKACARSPDERYASAAELEAALIALRDRLDNGEPGDGT